MPTSPKKLKPAASAAPVFIVNGKPLLLTGRLAEMLHALTQGPVRCPNLRRHSAAVHRLRKEHGVNIHTELITGPESTTGIYHLRARVRRATAAEVEAMRAKAKAKTAKAAKTGKVVRK